MEASKASGVKTKVTREVAVKEVEEWLDYKRIRPGKREERKDEIETLVDSIEAGEVIKGEDQVLKYTLMFPLEGSGAKVEILEFKPRLTGLDLEPILKGIKATDADGRLRAYISALTGQPMGVIKKLDTEDSTIPNTIALFFL